MFLLDYVTFSHFLEPCWRTPYLGNLKRYSTYPLFMPWEILSCHWDPLSNSSYRHGKPQLSARNFHYNGTIIYGFRLKFMIEYLLQRLYSLRSNFNCNWDGRNKGKMSSCLHNHLSKVLRIQFLQFEMVYCSPALVHLVETNLCYLSKTSNLLPSSPYSTSQLMLEVYSPQQSHPYFVKIFPVHPSILAIHWLSGFQPFL